MRSPMAMAMTMAVTMMTVAVAMTSFVNNILGHCAS